MDLYFYTCTRMRNSLCLCVNPQGGGFLVFGSCGLGLVWSLVAIISLVVVSFMWACTLWVSWSICVGHV